MNSFWKKKLPAFLLALILTVGAMPAALAASHEGNHVWAAELSSDSTGHWRRCTVTDCTERQDEGSHTPGDWEKKDAKYHVKKCKVCGYEMEQEEHTLHVVSDASSEPTCYQDGTKVYVCVCGYTRTDTTPATNKHVPATSWSSNDTYHWHACTTPGCPDTSASYAKHTYDAGVYTTSSTQHWQICKVCNAVSPKTAHTDSNRDGRCDVCAYGVTTPSTSASSGEIVLRVAPGSKANLKVSRFEDVFKKLCDTKKAPLSVYFYPEKDYTSFPGTLRRSSTDLNRDKLEDLEFYFADKSEGDYALSTLSFQADKSAKDGKELAIPFEIVGASDECEGTLRIIIDKDGEEGDVTYRAAPGGSVAFSRADFNKAYQSLSGYNDEIKWVELDPDDDYTGFSGKIRVLGKSNFTQRELSRASFYYKDDDYGDYAIDDLIFLADSSAKDGDALEIPFTAYYSKDDKAEGTLRIIIDKDGSRDTVTVTAAPGGSVKLDRAAFNKVFQYLSGTKDTVHAVSFEAPSGYKSFDGSLYADGDRLRPADLAHDENWFYYNSRDKEDRDDYLLEDLTFETQRNAREGASLAIPFYAYYDNDRDYYEEGTLMLRISSEASAVSYEAAPGGTVNLSAEDFNKAYQSLSGDSRTVRYVAFEADGDYTGFAGRLYTGNTPLARNSLSYDQVRFYYNNASYGTYSLSSLSFRPDASAKNGSTLSIPFRAYYDSDNYEQGVLKLTVSSGGDIACTVTPGKTVNFDRTKFEDFFRKSYSGSSLDYVVFDVPSASEFPDSSGTLYAGYGTSYSYSFTRSRLEDVRFYYDEDDAGREDYAINDLTFAAANSFTSGKVTLRFTACGSNDREVEGTLVITPATASVTSSLTGSVRYAVTTGTNVQINANDLAQFFKSVYPSGSLQYVTLGDVPAAGALYYNYYSASRYGSSAREQITASNRSRNFYMSPASFSEYALTELTYVPSGANYCASIPFTAYGVGGQSAAGAILISVTNKAVSEVYGPTPKNTAVTFPASSIAAAVSSATGVTPSGVQLLKLPAANVGAVYVGSGTVPADTSTVYGCNTGSQQLGQLRFVPRTGYTGPVEIPYVALNASNVPIASGVFSMGVLNSNRKFGDVNAATWCYKYVTELADAAVISGYSDGNFRPDSTITYGAALKLIMLAAGYPEQAPTPGGGTFSGYLAKAQADGLITRSNVNLSGPITRLQVAQLAAGALKLDINNLSSVKPFTDTSDVYVQALNAAGIVGGYFSNGVSTFRPSGTLTRGQVSAIVWRMQNYRR
ncbi:MAG: S-layer homology domain-containing protein [Dysosmobacter sp.]|nr:S-layer homology domain-containing protein [Dysosmobacter sp.]